jgi:hypothetical protein
MDSRIVMIAETEAGLFDTIKGLREKRKELEKVTPPERKDKLTEWRAEREGALKAQMKQIAIDVVTHAERDVQSIWSEPLLLEYTLKNMEREQVKIMWPFVMLQYIPLITESLENALYGKEKEAFDSRFRQIDNEIIRIEVLIPKPFAPELINVDKRFPIDRIGQTSDGKYYDRWLQEGLKEKKLIFFDSPQYVDFLIRYYHEVYWATAEREKAAKQPPPPVEVKAEPQIEPVSPYISEFFQPEREEGPVSLQGRTSRIYHNR